jgi:hypothetical protein
LQCNFVHARYGLENSKRGDKVQGAKLGGAVRFAAGRKEEARSINWTLSKCCRLLVRFGLLVTLGASSNNSSNASLLRNSILRLKTSTFPIS